MYDFPVVSDDNDLDTLRFVANFMQNFDGKKFFKQNVNNETRV